MDDEKVEQSGPPQLSGPLSRQTLSIPPCPACGRGSAGWDLANTPVLLKCGACGFHAHRNFTQWWAFDAWAKPSNATDVQAASAGEG
jgi:hypothetical protein